MARFRDVYLNSRIMGYPAQVAPMFATQIVIVDSGAEQANARWANALRAINIPDGVRDHATFEALKDHWLIMGGPAHTWPWRDPTDFASIPLVTVNTAPVVTGLDVTIGTGDGVTTSFQLFKRYTLGGFNYDRPIHYPVVSSVLVRVDGVDTEAVSPVNNWSVTREGGVVTFDTAPGVGDVVTAGFLFDLQVRFENDETFKGIMRTLNVSGFADIPLMEVTYCED